MKLAEALIERAELQKQNAQLIDRIKKNAKVQEGDNPAENPSDLIEQYNQNMARFYELVTAINKTNNVTSFDENLTVSDAIAKRDALGTKIKAYREIYQAATITVDRYSKNEIRFVRSLDIKELQEQINQFSKEFRELDTKLQGLNWVTSLL